MEKKGEDLKRLSPSTNPPDTKDKLCDIIREMKDFKHCKLIRLPIYPFTITFCILKKDREHYLTNKVANSEARTEKDEKNNIFIYLKEKAPMDVVAHEIFHATEFIMLTINQKMEQAGGNEAWAYLMEYITREYLKFAKHRV